ncbi:MAG: TetR family transcriptional regulator [Pseudomonadota bacterium]|nr:TetR family transcriptional regulator [Pseudomonadota bacterium]
MTRREEIVTATLELLATTPLDRVTTRGIAARVGITQPALFRHFEGRDAIVEAAVTWTRGELEGVAAAVLSAPAPPLVRAEALARALGHHVTRWPGVPRLLFEDVARGEDTAWSAALRGLQQAQRALVAGLVREAVARGEAPAAIDPDRAGALFVAGIQGVLVQWLVGGATGTPDVLGFVEVWRAGVVAGLPRSPVGEDPGASAPVRASEADVWIDATAILRGGADPLSAVLAAADRVAPGGALRVVAPFAPMPLGALLRGRGWAVEIACATAGGPYTLVARRPA